MSDVVEAIPTPEVAAVRALWRDMEGARELLRSYLEAALPMVAETMAEAGQPLDRLPEVIESAPPEPRAEAWPHVNVVAQDVLTVTLIDPARPIGPAPAVPSVADPNPALGAVYLVTYSLRVYHRVRGQGYADTVAARERLAKAIRLALLSDLTLGAGTGVEVLPESLTGSFSDVDRHQNRSIAAAYTNVAVRLEETLTYSTAAVAGTVTATPSLLPHPALT